jgi:hypothetical protein
MPRWLWQRDLSCRDAAFRWQNFCADESLVTDNDFKRGDRVLSFQRPEWLGTVIGVYDRLVLVRWRDECGERTQPGWAIEDADALVHATLWSE